MTKHPHTPADPSIIQGSAGVPDSATCAGCGKTIEAAFGEPWRVVRQATKARLGTETYRADRSHYSDTLDRLHEGALMAAEAGGFIRATVDEARKEGATWEDIGRELGISKQGAQKRFGV